MPERRRSHLLVLLALAAPSFVSSIASTAVAQGPAAPAPGASGAAPAPGTPATAGDAAPPRAADEPRPPLVGDPPPPPPAQGAAINPARDQQQLVTQGSERPPGTGTGEAVTTPREIFSDDWWGHTRPVIDIHGYFRTRAELFHNFTLGRQNSSNFPSSAGDPQYLWPIPIDQSYTGINTPGQTVAVCGGNPTPNSNCTDKTESGANLRFRLNPEIHISDNLRIMSQVDLLDNLVLGSTPNSYASQPGSSTGTGQTSTTGYSPVVANALRSNYAPVSFLSTTQGPPTAGVNGWSNSVAVQRVWGEYMTPVGQLRFGRMPDHWGLGIVANAGNGIDSDYQSNVDRIMFVTGLKSLDLYFGGAWDFPSSGPTSASPYDVYGGQAYNTCNLCNVNEWVAFLVHKTNPEIQQLKLSRGDVVLNGGAYTLYRSQYIDQVPGTTPMSTNFGDPTTATNNGLEPRQAWALIPDLWIQALWRKLRFEAEAVTIQGQLGYLNNFATNVNNPVSIRQYGLATQTEFRAIDDKLDLQFGFGWASGDAYANNSGTNALQPPSTGLQGEYTSGGQVSPISTFRFHPDYRIDLIFWREIMTRVEGAYYFRPSVDYDFIRHPDGEKFGGGAAVIWSRASEFIQTPGHSRDLGVELDLQLYYQSKDGSLNDDPNKLGGFYAKLQYGVFFPLSGLDYLPLQNGPGLSAAQAARLFLGIAF